LGVPALKSDLFGHSMAQLPDSDNLLLTTVEGVLTAEAQLLCDVALMLADTEVQTETAARVCTITPRA
jgi:hypothetical protein